MDCRNSVTLMPLQSAWQAEQEEAQANPTKASTAIKPGRHHHPKPFPAYRPRHARGPHQPAVEAVAVFSPMPRCELKLFIQPEIRTKPGFSMARFR